MLVNHNSKCNGKQLLSFISNLHTIQNVTQALISYIRPWQLLTQRLCSDVVLLRIGSSFSCIYISLLLHVEFLVKNVLHKLICYNYLFINYLCPWRPWWFLVSPWPWCGWVFQSVKFFICQSAFVPVSTVKEKLSKTPYFIYTNERNLTLQMLTILLKSNTFKTDKSFCLII